jgi:ribose 5-phosphate isomerase A
MNAIQEQKKQAAEFAANKFIQPGMTVGLGFGSTAIHAVNRIGDLIQDGTLSGIKAIACALSTEEHAASIGIPIIDFTETTSIDVTIDGADEVDPNLNLIKGGGAALTREKIVAQASRREVIVVDASKHSPHLGTRWPVPLEVIPFGWQSQAGFLRSIGAEPILRRNEDGKPIITDQGNYIIDANFGPIEDPQTLVLQLESRAGIVEHGIFLNLATDVVTATSEGITHTHHEA